MAVDPRQGGAALRGQHRPGAGVGVVAQQPPGDGLALDVVGDEEGPIEPGGGVAVEHELRHGDALGGRGAQQRGFALHAGALTPGDRELQLEDERAARAGPVDTR